MGILRGLAGTGGKALNTEVLSAGDLPINAAAAKEITALAARAAAARGVLMKVIGFAGSQVENRLEALPDAAKEAIESATLRALELAYKSAEAVGRDGQVPDIGRNGHALAAALTGAAGGFGGLASALVEIPVTVAIMFAAIQTAARAEGFDPADEAVRRECLMIFATGDPTDPADDGMNTSFLLSRVTISGASLHRLIATVAPRLAGLLTQKLAAQTVPVLGSVAGAGVNFAFMRYYRELAEIRFALLRLSRLHGEAAVRERFIEARAAGRIARA